MKYDSVFHRIAACPLPLVMYGTGDGADRICDILSAMGREIECFFASDDFGGKGRSFRGLPVLRYRDVCRLYRDFAVVLGFGSARPDVLYNIRRIASERTLFVPDIAPVPDPRGPEHDMLTRGTLDAMRSAVGQAEELMSDEMSKRLFGALLSFRLGGCVSDLDGTASDDLYLPLYHSPKIYRAAADLGSNRGQSSLEMLERFPMLETVIAVEPDEHSFRRIGEAVMKDCRIEPHNAAAWHENALITVMSDGSRGTSESRAASAPGRRIRPLSIRAVRFDDILSGRECQLIHIDVEGAERQALAGCRETISRCRPDVMLSVYHYQRDLWELPLLLHELMPEKRLHLRRPDALPPWDVICIAEG